MRNCVAAIAKCTLLIATMFACTQKGMPIAVALIALMFRVRCHYLSCAKDAIQQLLLRIAYQEGMRHINNRRRQ
jgi:hypothetical protein